MLQLLFRRVLAVVAFVVSSFGTLNAGAVTEVTPANIEEQPFDIRVVSEPMRNGATIRFTVSVATAVESQGHMGWFEIADDVVRERDTKLQPLFAWCHVAAVIKGGDFTYQFGVVRELLPRTSFRFFNIGSDGSPNHSYKILLAEFAPAE